MPRANRYQQPGMICHLTHRCHDRDFLFRFAIDRSEYRKRLRNHAREFGVSILNYCITSTHCHDLVVESIEGGISEMMQRLEGEFAGFYNRRKNRSGAFWDDRYHCTMVEDGAHLWNCTQYIDLNMIRAGVVAHPREWQWCGYMELMGERKRYRLLDMPLLLSLLGQNSLESFRTEYRHRIEHAILEKKLYREKRWTESIAVGGREFVEKIAAAIHYEHLKPRIEKDPDGSWTIWEPSSNYRTIKR